MIDAQMPRKSVLVLAPGLFLAYSNLRSYKSAAMSTTKQEPALCTKAPVVGVNNPRTDKVTAIKLIHIDKAILNLIV